MSPSQVVKKGLNLWERRLVSSDCWSIGEGKPPDSGRLLFLGFHE